MPSTKIIQLRQALADKFPGLRLRLPELPPPPEAPPEGLSPLADLFQNHLVKGALHEVVAGRESGGGATFLRALMQWAAAQNQIMALVDGADSFDVTALEPAELARLLWVRCSDAEKSMQAMDLLLRDGNLPLVLLDLKLNPESQLRKIPATTWHRLHRLVETTSAVCVALTPRAMIASAHHRIILKSDFALADLEREADDLERALKWDLTGARYLEQNILHSA